MKKYIFLKSENQVLGAEYINVFFNWKYGFKKYMFFIAKKKYFSNFFEKQFTVLFDPE